MKIFGTLIISLIFCQINCLQINDFYPFGQEVGDTILYKNDDGFQGPISISTTFPFFQKSYSFLFINTNGLISFERGIQEFTPSQFPLFNVIGVAPYWTDTDTRVGGDIFFREILDSHLLLQIASDIRRAFPLFPNFRPTWAYICTWYQVAAYNSNNPRSNNTYQAVIATNGRYSFTIFNYEKLMWPNQYITMRSQAGFNAGDGVNYYIIPGSFTNDIVNISQLSNVGINGKWIFRVDSSNITSGGCSSSGYLTVNPNTVYYIGGVNISLSGPCFNLNDDVKIIYDNSTQVECVVTSESFSSCLVPFLDRVGRIPIELIVNQKNVFKGWLNAKEKINNNYLSGFKPFYTYSELNNIVNITWDSKYRISNENEKYSLFLTIVDEETKLNNFIEIESDLSQSSYKLIKFSDYVDQLTNSRLKNFKRKFINIGVGFTNIIYKAKYFFINIAIRIDLKDDLVQQCKEWHEKQPDPKHYLESLPPCPRQINPSFPSVLPLDPFTEDSSCNKNNPKFCENFHPGAKGCYRSEAIGLKNSRQQCCYGSDGNLLVGPPGGGTLDLGNGLWDHLELDVDPYYMCCKFSNNCNLYYDKRPSDDGRRWQPPRPSGLSGDPHFLTLDNLKYTFNGWGEFVLLNIEEIKFDIQVRLQPLMNSGEQNHGTVFKGVVVNGENIDKVQIELDSSNNLLVYLNGLIFDSEDKEYTLVLNNVTLVATNASFSLLYTNGVIIRLDLIENSLDSFNIITIVPEKFKQKTLGLLGTFDGNTKNEFTLPDKTVVQIEPENDREIFYKFGLYWAVNSSSSLFTYEEGFSHLNYQNLFYIPLFISEGIKFEDANLELAAIEVCKNNKQCLFDISATGKISIGESSLKFEEDILKINEEILIAETSGANIAMTSSNLLLLLSLVFYYLWN